MTSNTFMSIDEAETAIQRINHTRIGSRIDQLSIEPYLDENGEVQLQVRSEEDRVLLCDKKAEKSVLKAIGVGRRLLDGAKDDLELLQNAINRGKAKAKEDGMVVLTVTGANHVMDIHPGEGLNLSLAETWNVLKQEPGMRGVAEIPDLGRGRYDLRLLTVDQVNTRRDVGDITMVGVRVNVSNVITLNPFIYRLACSNGMQRETAGGILEVNLADPIASLRECYALAHEGSKQLAKDFVDTEGLTMPNPLGFANRMLRLAGAPDRSISQILNRVEREAPNGTAYEILNVVTAVAREKGDTSMRSRNNLESVAGRILTMTSHGAVCNMCGAHN